MPHLNSTLVGNFNAYGLVNPSEFHNVQLKLHYPSVDFRTPAGLSFTINPAAGSKASGHLN